MSNDNGKSPMPNDRGNDGVLTAFKNLNLCGNYNCYEPGEASNSDSTINSSNNHPNVNVYNVAHISAASFNVNAPPFTPPRMIQPGASFTRNPTQPFLSPLSFVSPGVVKDRNFLSRLLDMMTCKERHTEFQKFLQHLDTYPTAAERESKLSAMGSLLTKNNCTFLDLATNQYGSQALRILFRRSPVLDHLTFRAVCMNFFTLMTNRYGRGLVNLTIRAVDKTRKEDLYRLTYEYTLDLARIETGCLALNDVFQEIRGEYRDLIFQCVAKNADWLSFDPYGTHVVQNFLTLKNPGATAAIAERLRGSFFRLAKERLGTYVVEKCLDSAFARDKVLQEFKGNDREWVKMANDKFGNFVAQYALKVMMKEKEMTSLLREFVEKLRPHFCKMKIGHGKNTLKLIQEIEGWIH